ncbi:MAG: hypothetical protein WCY34_01320 [Candidatus Omnitrophota bacterium]|jgi:Tfp pilus assembly protein PilV
MLLSRNNKINFIKRINGSSKFTKGLSLIELMVAALFLVIVIVSILLLFIACIQLNESSRNLTTATTHAQCIMENIENSDFSEIQTKSDNGDWDLSAEDIETVPYSLTALTNETVNATVVTEEDLVRVTVEVSWQDSSGRNRSTSLVTYVADRQ